jgi:hypothetical protein
MYLVCPYGETAIGADPSRFAPVRSPEWVSLHPLDGGIFQDGTNTPLIMDEELEVDSTEYLDLERERRELAEVLFAKGVITGSAIERERAEPRLVPAERAPQASAPS